VLGLLGLSFQLNTVIYFFLQAAGMAITVEFTWEVHGLRAPTLKRLAQVALVVFNLCGLDGQLATTPSTITRLSTPAVMLPLWSSTSSSLPSIFGRFLIESEPG
jgi:hypothetical protein